ncbi:MAG: serine/threonine protein kinase [Vulcanimicrobiota bacterium]
MPFREPAPDGSKGVDNLPLHVLTAGTLLKSLYKVKYLTAGGMSILYTASGNGEQFLIKEVEATDSRNVLALTQEKSTLERLNHPGIVKVYDIFEQDGFYYMVLNYIEGQSMEKLISPIPNVFIQEKVILNWALQICDIFEYLHRQSPPIIYRDLKPRNLVKDMNGRVHLVDFGIARVYKQGRSKDTEAMGSAITASPEHYGGAQTDERSDIFTIGATLHFLITNGKGVGDEPFRLAPVRSINPKISENMEQVIKKCLELEPRKRYQSVKEMRQALLNSREVPLPVIEPFGDIQEGIRTQHGRPINLEEDSSLSPASRSFSPVTVLAAAAFCILILIGGIFAVNRITESGKKNPQQTAGVTTAAFVISTSSAPADTPAAAATPTVITALSSNTESPATVTGTEPSSQTSSTVPATVMISPPDRLNTPDASPSQGESPSPPRGNYNSNPPEIGYPTQSGERNRHKKRETSDMMKNFSYTDSQNPSALPVVRSGGDPQASDIKISRLYRDSTSGYQIILPKGWTVDNRLIRMESRQDPNVVGAFSHTPPSFENPVTAIIVRLVNANSNIKDPQPYLQRWISADLGTPRIARLISTSPVKESTGRSERAVSDMVMMLRGKEVLQTRMVYVDSAKNRIALIKCYFRANDLENAHTVKQLESPVIDSFSFTEE